MKTFLCFVLFWSIHLAFGQNSTFSKKDSLVKVLENEKDPKRKIDGLLQIARLEPSEKSTSEFLQSALDLANSSNDKERKAVCLQELGIWHMNQSDSVQAKTHFSDAYKIFSELNLYENSISCLSHLAEMQKSSKNYTKSIDLYKQAIRIAINNNLKLPLAKSYKEIAHVQYRNLNFPESFEYNFKAKQLFEEENDTSGKIGVLKNLGELYFHLNQLDKTLELIDQILDLASEAKDYKNLAFANAWKGNIYMNKGNLAESQKYYAKSITIRKQIGDLYGLSSDYSNLAFGYQLLADYENALKYHQKTYELLKGNNFKFSEILYWKDVGILIQKAPDQILEKLGIHPKKRFQTSLEYELKALAIAEELDDIPQITYILSSMLFAYEKMGDYKSAFQTNQRLLQMQQGLEGQELKAEIARKEVQHYFEIKEAETKTLNEKNKAKLKLKYSIALSVFCLIAILGFLLYYVTRMKKKKEKAIYLAQQQILKLEKEKIENELNQAKAEMESFLENLNEKNQLIERISMELINLESIYDEGKMTMQTKLAEIKNSVILTEEDWKIFLNRFEKIYPGLVLKIKLEMPKITTAELRYLMLVKIGLSNKDMADALGVSLNTIHVTWKRLREKMEYSKEETPLQILNNLELRTTEMLN